MAKLDKERREQYSRKVEEDFPGRLEMPVFIKRLSLRYGMNPGEPAAFYAEEKASGPNMASFNVLQEGKGLGYINLGDMDLGMQIVRHLYFIFDRPTCCIVKHEMPSGVAIGENVSEAFERAFGCDPMSSFGGVYVFSHTLSQNVAQKLVEKERNVEVVCAPFYESDSLDVFKERKNLRVIQIADITTESVDNGLDFKRVEGGLLVQYKSRTRIRGRDDLECVSEKQPTDKQIRAAVFNWVIASYTRSNAIVIGTENKTHGIGSGQRSRIDAAYDAIRFANGRDGMIESYGSQGTFMASDAYMPFPDVVELAARNGVEGIIYPLGSERDKQVIESANEKGLVMLVTRKPGTQDCERCFTHR